MKEDKAREKKTIAKHTTATPEQCSHCNQTALRKILLEHIITGRQSQLSCKQLIYQLNRFQRMQCNLRLSLRFTQYTRLPLRSKFAHTHTYSPGNWCENKRNFETNAKDTMAQHKWEMKKKINAIWKTSPPKTVSPMWNDAVRILFNSFRWHESAHKSDHFLAWWCRQKSNTCQQRHGEQMPKAKEKKITERAHTNCNQIKLM